MCVGAGAGFATGAGVALVLAPFTFGISFVLLPVVATSAAAGGAGTDALAAHRKCGNWDKVLYDEDLAEILAFLVRDANHVRGCLPTTFVEQTRAVKEIGLPET